MSVQFSFMVAKSLLEGEFASHFAKVPSALDDEQPIVLHEGPFERSIRMEDAERGTVAVEVLVVREIAADAETDAAACEQVIRSCQWERNAENGRWRVAGLDTTAPAFRERDGSGRFVWGFDVVLTVVRSL